MPGGENQLNVAPSFQQNFFNTDLPSNERGEPPTYEEVINPNAPPPSYDSLFGRVRKAQRTSKGVFEFLKNILMILLGTIGCTVILGVTILIPICMIAMGSIYLYECPQGDHIPIYLLVGGIIGILKQLLHLSSRMRQTAREEEEEQLTQSTQTFLNCFMLGWFIIGSIGVYKEFEPNYDPNAIDGRFCNKSLYLFAFWLVTFVYILLGIVSVWSCSLNIANVIFNNDRC